jgi:hypothetical protein
MLDVSLSISADLALTAIEQSRAAGTDLRTFLVATLQRALAAAPAVPSQAGDETLGGWTADAMRRAEKIADGQEFKLQDLFSKDEWKRIPAHTMFGRDFRKSVEGRKLATHVGKTKANEAIYRRAV